MSPRKTRQKIKDHLDSAINHVGSACEQISISMTMGEERSPDCFYLLPKVVEALVACREWIEKIRGDM